MLNKLREQVDIIIANNKDEKYLLIKDILAKDDCFFNMDIETSLSILKDLGYDDEQAKKLYISLIDKENFK